jgi:hypothetical protein
MDIVRKHAWLYQALRAGPASMKLIPSLISPDTKSRAEREVFALLEEADVGPCAVALHSLNLTVHRDQWMGEIDFVVLTPECLLVCEVKGGRLRRRDDGGWESISRAGRPFRLKKSPVQQACSAMWSLRDELRRLLPASLVSSINFGYCVITPDVRWTVDSVDEPRALVIDADDLADNDIVPALQRLVGRWSTAGKHPNPPLAPSDWERVRDAMRPAFDLVPSLRHGAKDARDQLERLTVDQYKGLAWVQDVPRLLVSGGAGTGKTLLAAEVARRDHVRGRVLLTCQSPVLAAFLARRVTTPGVVVLPVDEAREVAVREGPWDVVVLDEAQDIFTDDGLDVLDELVVGGAQDGLWRLFYDINNQAGLHGRVDEAFLEVLKESGAAQVTLDVNCRNAPPVILYTRSMTGADLGQPTEGEGPEVLVEFPTDRAEEARLVSAELARLASEGVPGNDITILSFAERDDSVVASLPPRTRRQIRTFDERVATRDRPSGITFARIDDFKGLENDFVLVVDVGRLAGDRADAARLYIALSRARYGLWAAIPSGLQAEYDALRDKHRAAALAFEREQARKREEAA